MSRSDRILVAAGAGSLLLAVAAAAVLLLPAEAAPPADAAGLLLPTTAAPSHGGSPSPVPTTVPIVVDVAGAVAAPGLRELPAGARVGDAIAAAGGYASDADLDAAASSLNLAQRLGDGEQVRVPRLGEAAAGRPAASDAGAPAVASGETSTGGSRVDLNTASPEELEALPGIGPVTVQKIVAARQERPFTSLDDVVQRGVIHRGQLEDIRELATAG
ncbi:MAG: helix-hairpin-helix domain-containing protein [Chloroflexi bacterium]|nr:helix-hairpin-helix domain-containing protein [Chloroflexota bacterium]